MRILISAIGGLALASVTGCTSVYLHDEALAAKTSAAKTQIEASDLAAPFKQERAYLAEYGDREDRAVIDFMLSQRDRRVASMLKVDCRKPRSTADRPKRDCDDQMSEPLNRASEDGLNLLFGHGEWTSGTLEEFWTKAALVRFNERRRQSDENALSAARNNPDIVQLVGGKFPSCKELLSKPSPEQLEIWASAASDPQRDLRQQVISAAHRNCASLEEFKSLEQEMGPLAALPDAALGNGTLREALEQYQLAIRQTLTPEQGEIDAELNALIEEAKRIGLKKEGAQKELEQFISKAQNSLKLLRSGATELAWSRLESELDQIIAARICATTDEATAPARVEAGCNDLKDGSTTRKTESIWGLLGAFASLKDTRAIDGRNASWLLAAKAIATAEVETAKIEVRRDKAIAAHYKARLRALTIEASFSACAYLALNAPEGCDGTKGAHYSLASYLQAFNAGAVPAEVHLSRSIREDRIAAIDHASAVAERQTALIKGAVAQAKLYGESGFQAELVAQVLQALAIVKISGDP